MALITGTSGNDNSLQGPINEINYIYGLGGDDTIIGGNTLDVLSGGDGNDFIRAQGGLDYIYGGNGNDTAEGGDGIDFIFGESGDDGLFGGNDNDYLYGGAGFDYLDGGNGDDYLQGDDGDDILMGGSGNDWLLGGAGDDRLRGGFGSDTMYGGSGNDDFRPGDFNSSGTLNNNFNTDTIADFNPAGDRIDIYGFYQGINSSNDLLIVSDDALAQGATQRLVYSLESGTLFYNRNGAASGFGVTNEKLAILSGAPVLTPNNFF